MNKEDEQTTLRDRFAMAALTGLIASNEVEANMQENFYQVIARQSYCFADAMMKARVK